MKKPASKHKKIREGKKKKTFSIPNGAKRHAWTLPKKNISSYSASIFFCSNKKHTLKKVGIISFFKINGSPCYTHIKMCVFKASKPTHKCVFINSFNHDSLSVTTRYKSNTKYQKI